MASILRRLPVLTATVLFTGMAFAQTSAIEGTVKDQNGQPLQDALVKIVRKDIKGNYQVKTKKKGDFFHAGLPLGTYRVSVEVGGKEVDVQDGVRTTLGDPVKVTFDLQAARVRAEQLAKAAETGNLTQEQARDMSPEQKAALEKQMKERAASMQKNKALNDAFNTAMEALKMKQFDAAVESFAKAAELDPKQHVVWGNMAEAYAEIAKTKTAAERDAAYAKSLEAYGKALELAPTDANYHNNYALALAGAKKFDLMQEELRKAVQLDPANAGRYYYNMGAVLTNNNQVDAACEAFKQAYTSDASYADAHYQYGICLTSKATSTPDGKIIFPAGTAEAFQKYLELKPEGPYAESAKGMLATMGTTVETKYVAPGAKKPATPAKKK